MEGENCLGRMGRKSMRGYFKNGELNGFGISYNDMEKISFGGYFKNDFPHGEGVAYNEEVIKIFQVFL